MYQAMWGFSAVTTTVVFGIYAVAVLLGLLSLSTLSDYVGRKPVLYVGWWGAWRLSSCRYRCGQISSRIQPSSERPR
jgi:MFS family permease